MEVILHYPATAEKQAALSRQTAALYAEYIEEFLKCLHCPSSQKLALIDEIVKAAKGNVTVTKQKNR